MVNLFWDGAPAPAPAFAPTLDHWSPAWTVASLPVFGSSAARTPTPAPASATSSAGSPATAPGVSLLGSRFRKGGVLVLGRPGITPRVVRTTSIYITFTLAVASTADMVDAAAISAIPASPTIPVIPMIAAFAATDVTLASIRMSTVLALTVVFGICSIKVSTEAVVAVGVITTVRLVVPAMSSIAVA